MALVLLASNIGSVSTPLSTPTAAPGVIGAVEVGRKTDFHRNFVALVAALPPNMVIFSTDDLAAGEVDEEEVAARDALWAGARDGTIMPPALPMSAGMALLEAMEAVRRLPRHATTRARRSAAVDGIMESCYRRAVAEALPYETLVTLGMTSAEHATAVAGALRDIHATLTGSVMDLRQVLAAPMQELAFALVEGFGHLAPDLEGRKTPRG